MSQRIPERIPFRKDRMNCAVICTASRCVKSQRLSNGKSKGRNNARAGNRYLGWAWVEAANFARRFDPARRQFFDRRVAQTNRAVATKALACKLSKAAWHMAVHGTDYDPKRMFPGEPKE